MKIRQGQIESTINRINKIIKHPETKKQDISYFPQVQKYIKEKFSDVDISGIPIYLANSSTMATHGYADVGGFYFDYMHLIVVKKKVSGSKKHKNAFDRILSSWINLNVDVEDIVVHESLHAVSASSNRPNSKYRFDEEEFVYTNCVDFYLQKGMTTDEIVKGNFLPFCVNDIISDRKSFLLILNKFADQNGVQFRENLDFKSSALNTFLDFHARKLVPMIITAAEEMGHRMINLYNQYGRGLDTSPVSFEEEKTRPIVMDNDW